MSLIYFPFAAKQKKTAFKRKLIMEQETRSRRRTEKSFKHTISRMSTERFTYENKEERRPFSDVYPMLQNEAEERKNNDQWSIDFHQCTVDQ